MNNPKKITISYILAIFFPLLLLAPNIVAWVFSGKSDLSINAASVLTAGGIYWILISLIKRTWIAVLAALPLMVLCSFQIVVIYLYNDPAPIGVDMFLNVLTTNSSEAGELLSSLLLPIGIVCLLYLPPICLAIIAWTRRQTAPPTLRRLIREWGKDLLGFGVVLTIILCFNIQGFNPFNRYFPLNVFTNIVKAVERTDKTSSHSKKSAQYTFNATSSRPNDPETYIVVIGETSRADNWGLAGYARNTTPRLDSIGKDVVMFRGAMSECNVTHKAVPMLLSTVTADSFDDSIYFTKSIITAFKEAGFHTAFVSNQAPNHSFIEYFGSEADDVVYLPHTDGVPCDLECLPVVDSLLAGNQQKKLIVVHQYGSHYKYQDRYPRSLATFLPDDISQNSYEHRETLVNAYDNTIVCTDHLLAELINRLSTLSHSGALLYCSDHGEDIHDDNRHRFLHASPSPTFEQLHVPMVFFANEPYKSAQPEVAERTEAARNMLINSSEAFTHTLLQMAGIETFRLSPEESLLSPDYREPEILYFLDDWNRAVPLTEAHFHILDFNRLDSLSKTLHNPIEYEKNIAHKSCHHNYGGIQYLASRNYRED